jgi:hypothetical protein
MRRRASSPLEPATTVYFVMLGLMVALVGLSTVLSIFGSGSVWGIGRGLVTVELPTSGGSSPTEAGYWHLTDAAHVNVAGLVAWVGEPTILQQVWYTLTLMPSNLIFIGALVLAYRLFRGAERHGIYTTVTAGRLRTLGWFLLVGSVVATLIEMFAANWLLATVVTNEISFFGPIHWDVPLTLILTGTGVITFARVMRVGVGMRDELAATV